MLECGSSRRVGAPAREAWAAVASGAGWQPAAATASHHSHHNVRRPLGLNLPIHHSAPHLESLQPPMTELLASGQRQLGGDAQATQGGALPDLDGVPLIVPIQVERAARHRHCTAAAGAGVSGGGHGSALQPRQPQVIAAAGHQRGLRASPADRSPWQCSCTVRQMLPPAAGVVAGSSAGAPERTPRDRRCWMRSTCPSSSR